MTFPFYDYDSDFFNTEDLLFLAGASGKAVEDTATGNPVTFLTDLAKPLKSLIANFLPVQSSGTPSPDNILPITGWDAVNVFHAGKNLLKNKTAVRGSTSIYIGQDTSNEYPVYLVKGAKYTLTFDCDGSNTPQVYIQQNGGSAISFGTGKSVTYTATETGYYRMYVYVAGGVTEVTDFMLEVGETASTYEQFIAPVTYPSTFPSTIYGGYVDLVSGVLTVDYALVDASDLTWVNTNQSAIGVFRANLPTARNLDDKFNVYSDKYKNGDASTSIGYMPDNTIKGYNGEQYQDYVYIRDGRYTDVDDFTQGLDCEICYQLATPQIVQLTPQQINAIKGNNTIWSDANGDCSVTFLKKG